MFDQCHELLFESHLAWQQRVKNQNKIMREKGLVTIRMIRGTGVKNPRSKGGGLRNKD